MGNGRGFGVHLIFVCVFSVATTCTCLGVGNMTIVCSEQDRLALLSFKQSVVDESKILSSWVGNDCCRWEKIQCDGVSGNVVSVRLRGGYSFGGDHVVGKEMSSSLAELKHLRYMDLSGNDFGGSRIPEFIGSLKHLSYLNLSNARFQGTFSHHIRNLSNLKVLDLSSNSELTTNDMSWTFGLSSLEHLDLSSLTLGGAQNVGMVLYMIPSLNTLSLSYCGLSNADFINSSRMLSNIKHLDLGFNSFKGPLPSFFRNMTSLAFLDLSDYDISLAWNFANLLNMVPSLSELHLSSCGLDNTFLSSPHFNFSTLSNIQHLDFSDNSIEGTFPSLFTNMSSLRTLDLSRNILDSWVPVMPNLLELDLSFNEFKHIEDVGIWRQCHLKRLSVALNRFDKEMINSSKNASECSQYAMERLDLRGSLNGTVPKQLARMVDLRVLDLTDSELTGDIPESLGSLRFLEVLRLSSTFGLTGRIPDSLGRLRFLEVIDISYNNLIGPIPTFIGKLSKLDLSFNQINGSIPQSFEKLEALTDLNLQSNRLTGPIPDLVGKLYKLDLSVNRLNGSIPESLGRLVSLQDISLNSNMLSGPIPISIGQLDKLEYLDISNNSLEGVVFEAHFAKLSMLKALITSFNTKLTFKLSREWIPPFQLEFLDLRSCTIANEFPRWLRNQRKLRALLLSNTKISGPLPTWFRKVPIIQFLDLSRNKLSGPLRNLPIRRNPNTFDPNLLGVLFLVNNLFNESIPSSLCSRTDLGYLDLSRNRLTGKIPKCLENLQQLVTMIFSSNQLSGVIPTFTALNNSRLGQLKFNDNNLIGELPRVLGNGGGLYVLDLGDNRLSGNIPEWIGEELTGLMVLRLHNNNFRGAIPQSLCKTSRLQILDVAYNNLTGIIPKCLRELNAMLNSSLVTSSANPLNPDENVIQVMKGVNLQYTTTWPMVFNMDLSSNKLVGEIPVELTALSRLLGLNLSNNYLSGRIPDSIGNMEALNSLDFSRNELRGMIPPSMAALNFLSHLNLSHNNLQGQIPTGNQLQTLNDPSIYAGNKDLCGSPLPKNCSYHQDPTTTVKKKFKADSEPMEVGFYVGIISGFATGFWGFIGVLVFKKQWRQKLFMFIEKIMDKIYVVVMVRVAKLKRGREAA